ncbi:MFS transporter [soil metagenome]
MLARLGAGLGANYWKLWTSSAISNLADGVFFIALPLLAIRLTDSPALIAGLAFALRLPWLFFALIAGALADRLDRRRTMVLVQLLRAGLAAGLALAVVLGVESIWLLYVLALLLGIGETLFDTAAQSIMPNVVRRELLPLANGRLYAAEITMNQFVGPPLGGLLAAFAMVAAFGGSAVAWVVAALLMAAVVGAFRPVREGPPTRITTDIAEGLRYLWGHGLLRTFALMVGVMNLASGAAFAIFVLYAVAPGPMGLSEPAFGLLLTTTALGAVGGTLVAPRLIERVGRARTLVLSIAGNALLVGVPALTADPILIGVGFAVGSSTGMAWNIITVSLRQSIVPDRLIGRVNSAYRLLAWGTLPLGALLGGIIGQLTDLRVVFALAGSGSLLLLLARSVLNEEALRAAEAEAMPAGSAGS